MNARLLTGIAVVSLLTGCPVSFEGGQPGECSDDADNDGDGLFDCNDDDCSGSQACGGDDDDDDATGDDDDDAAGDDDDATGDDDDAVGDDDDATGDDDDAADAGDPPTQPEVVIVPPQPTTNDPITCVITTPSFDPEGGTVSYVYGWQIDGGPSGIATASVQPEDTTGGEVWTCEVTPWDAAQAGPAGSAEVTVQPEACSGGSLEFDGLNDVVEVASTSGMESIQEVTLDAWVRGSLGTIVHKEDQLDLSVSSNGNVYCLAEGHSSIVTLSAAWPTDDAWHHVACTFSDPGRALWLDGVEVDSAIDHNNGPQTSIDPLTVGANLENPGVAFEGLIDEVRLSSTVRYTSPFYPPPAFAADSDTLLLLHFDEGTGATAFDDTSWDADGTISGASWSSDHPCP